MKDELRMQLMILSLALSSPVFAAFLDATPPTLATWESYGVAGLAAAAFYGLVWQLLRQAVKDRKAYEVQLSGLLVQMQNEREASEERFASLVRQVLRGEERSVGALIVASKEMGGLRIAVQKCSRDLRVS